MASLPNCRWISRVIAVALMLLLASLVMSGSAATAPVGDDTCPAHWAVTQVALDGAGLVTEILPGTMGGRVEVALEYEISNPSDCPDCLQQIVIALGDQPLWCAYHGTPAVCPELTTGSDTFAFSAPDVPGTYRLYAYNEFQYNCPDAMAAYPGRDLTPIGTMHVVDPGETAVSLAVGDQVAPAVAYDPDHDQYLVVWEDWRNDDGSRTNADIYGRLLNRDGAPVSGEFVITDAPGNQTRPAVAYGGAVLSFDPFRLWDYVYLVVWEDERAEVTNERDVYGQWVVVDDLPSGSGFEIATSPGDQVAPVVACTGQEGNCLVVWSDEEAGALNADIHGRVTGWIEIWPPPAPFPISTATGRQGWPTIAYNAVDDEYLVAWQDDRRSDWTPRFHIYGQRVSSIGALLDNPGTPADETDPAVNFPISTTGWDSYPAAAHNPAADQYLVAWSYTDFGDVYGQTVDAQGALVGDNFVISDHDASQWVGGVAHNASAGRHTVVWEEWPAEEDAEISLRRVLPPATPLIAEQSVAQARGDQWQPTIACSSAAPACWVAWQDGRSAEESGADIYGTLYTFTDPVAGPDLSTSTKEGPMLATVGQQIPYTLTLVNTGDVTAYNLGIVDPIPAGLSFVEGSLTWTGGTASYDAQTRTVSWFGDVEPCLPNGPILAGQSDLTAVQGCSVTVSFDVRVDVAGRYPNTADLHMGEFPLGVLIAETVGAPGNDLVPLGIRPVQVVWNPRLGGDSPVLVEDKNTVFEVTIGSTFDQPVMANLQIEFGPDAWETPYANDLYVTSRPVTLQPGVTRILPLPLEEDIPWQTSTRLPIVYAPRPIKQPTSGVALTVDPDNRVAEVDEANNRLPAEDFTAWRVRETMPLDVHYVGVSFPWETPPRPAAFASRSSEFVLGTYPVADEYLDHSVDPIRLSVRRLRFDSRFRQRMANRGIMLPAGWVSVADLRSYDHDGNPDTPQIDLLHNWHIAWWIQRAVMEALSTSGWLGQAQRVAWDRVVGVVPARWAETNFDERWRWRGVAASRNIKRAVLVDTRSYKTTAHEVGHTYGLWLNGYDIPGQRGSPDRREEYHVAPGGANPATGYWVNHLHEIKQGFCFMGNVVDEGSWPPTGGGGDIWVDDDCFNELLFRFASFRDPELLGVRGTFYDDGTVELRPWHRLAEGRPDLEPDGSGSHALIFLDAQGQVLSRILFDVAFENPKDVVGRESPFFMPFAFTVPFPPETHRVQIRTADGRLLAQRGVSADPPQVTVLTPSGGEVLLPDQAYTVTWQAHDPDGDALSYTVLISPDEGETWHLLASDLEKTGYTWEVTDVPEGTRYLMRVVASDGVNVGEDISDTPFAVLSQRIYMPVVMKNHNGES